MEINLDILDNDQRDKVLEVIENSKLTAETKRIAKAAIKTYQLYKSAHGSLFRKAEQLERQLKALHNS